MWRSPSGRWPPTGSARAWEPAWPGRSASSRRPLVAGEVVDRRYSPSRVRNRRLLGRWTSMHRGDSGGRVAAAIALFSVAAVALALVLASSAAAASFTARGSVEQVYATGLPAGS